MVAVLGAQAGDAQRRNVLACTTSTAHPRQLLPPAAALRDTAAGCFHLSAQPAVARDAAASWLCAASHQQPAAAQPVRRRGVFSTDSVARRPESFFLSHSTDAATASRCGQQFGGRPVAPHGGGRPWQAPCWCRRCTRAGLRPHAWRLSCPAVRSSGCSALAPSPRATPTPAAAAAATCGSACPARSKVDQQPAGVTS